MIFNKVDAYHWIDRAGLRICRIKLGGRWLFELWGPKPAQRNGYTQARCLARCSSLADAALEADKLRGSSWP